MGIFDGLFRWKCPATGTNFSKFVNEKLKELKAAGCEEKDLADMEKKIERHIKEGSKDEWIKSNIELDVKSRIQYVKMNIAVKSSLEDSNKQTLNRQLQRIEREYPKEEQEFYKTYTIEQYKSGEPIDLNKVARTIESHLRTVGFGQAAIDEFMVDINKEIKNSQNLKVSLSFIVGKLAGKLNLIKQEKESLNKSIESKRNPKNLSETDRMFESIYGSEYQKRGENYLEELTNNRINIMKTKFDIEFGHDKKRDLIRLAEEQLTLLGYSHRVVIAIRNEILEATEGIDGTDFVAKVSNLTQKYANRNIRNIEDYTDEINMSMIDKISDEFGMQGKEGTEEFIRKLLSVNNAKLNNMYETIDRKCLIPPDRSAEISEYYDKLIRKYQEENPIAAMYNYSGSLEIKKQLAQIESQLAHVRTMRF